MLARITKRSIDALKPAATDVLVWDAGDEAVKGFGVKVTPKGRRVFVYQYWAPHSQRVRRRVTLGAYGVLTVDEARLAAKRLAGRVANGEDPAGEASEQRALAKDTTVEQLATSYLAENRAKVKARTFLEYEQQLRRVVLPALGRKPVAHVTLRDIAGLHHSLRETPVMANRILSLISAFLNWTEKRGYRSRGSNPCRDIARFPEQSRERFLSVEEIGRLAKALAKAENEGIPAAPSLQRKSGRPEMAKHRPKKELVFRANVFATGAIRFLLLTGLREQEALTLRWSDLDLARGIASLPNTKTGRSYRPIGAPAVALLSNLLRVRGNPFVFCGAKEGDHLKDIKRLWYAVRHTAGLEGVRLHDLRHTVASFSVGAGHSLYLTGKLLGHTRAETTQRYAHFADDARKAAADTVAGAIASAMEPAPAPDVMPLASRRSA